MILPTTYTATLLLLIVSMLCWGSWANTQKLSGKWRFELFYFDYSIGVLLMAIIAALTVGSMGNDTTIEDNLYLAGKRQMATAIISGAVFNLANILLVAAISVAGMSVAFPVGIGLALVIGVLWNYLMNQQGNPALLFGGAALMVGAIVLSAMAHGAHLEAKAAEAGKKKSSKSSLGVMLAVGGGVLMGVFYPILEWSKDGDIGLTPYAAVLFFAIGVLASTPFYNLYFMNLPVKGEPVPLSQYFKGTMKQHLLGLLGGIIWCIGLTANQAAASAPKSVNVGPAISYGLGQGAALVSTLWGLLVWKEFAGAVGRVRTLLLAMLVCFVAGLVLVSLAPLY